MSSPQISEYFPSCEVLPAYDVTTTEGRIAWLQQRREGIGSSDCSAILGLSKYATPLSIWLDKTGQTPLLSDQESEAMEWGTILEPVIREKAAERLGLAWTTSPALRSLERPWQQYNPDGLLFGDPDVPEGQPVLLEIKNVSAYLSHEWADDQASDHAELQLQHGMAVTGAPHAYAAGLIGGNRLVVRRIDRDQELIDHINREEAAFWQKVLDREPPAITARESLASILGSGDPADADAIVLDADDADEARRWMAAYQMATADERAAKAAKDEARNNLVWLAKGHGEIAGPDGETIARLQRGVFSAKRFEVEEPDLAAEFLRKVEVVDTQALRAEHPGIYRRYQSVSIRAPKSTRKGN